MARTYRLGPRRAVNGLFTVVEQFTQEANRHAVFRLISKER